MRRFTDFLTSALTAPPSVGVLRVTVRPFALPDTSTEAP